MFEYTKVIKIVRGYDYFCVINPVAMENISRYSALLRKFCEANADEALVAKYARYFTKGYDAWGVDGALMREEYKLRTGEWKLTPEETIALCDRLFRGKSEEIYFAVWFLRDLKKKLTKAHFDLLRGWFDNYVRNWAHCDVIVSEVMSVFFKNRIIGAADFREWLTSESPYTRRAVPVSYIWIVKKDPGVDPAVLFDYIHPLVTDPEKPVRQGAGWFLREAWKKHPGETEAFLTKIRTYSARLVIQYATEKMDKEARARFKRDAS